MTELAVYVGLFLAAFVAATLVPSQSEAVLAATVAAGYPPLTAVAVASVGNVLGSVVNWVLGRFIGRFRDRPWFPVREQALVRAERWYRCFGMWSRLLSRVPRIGGPAARHRVCAASVACKGGGRTPSLVLNAMAWPLESASGVSRPG